MSKEHLINHVCLIVDSSSSMENLSDSVIKVFDNTITHLKNLSEQTGQEVRCTIYTFADKVKNHIFDMDVLRVPSLKSIYKAYGNTALFDATIKGIEDLKLTNQLYSSHSFLLYILTDGYENRSVNKMTELEKTLNGLSDNWTVAMFVPDASSKTFAQKYGFPKDNIAIWSTTSDGMSEVGDSIKKTTTEYMTARSQGIRSVKNLFSLQTSQLKDSVVKTKLTELKPSDYSLLPVTKKIDIKSFVEGWKLPYIAGCAYFQLTKPEKVQPTKQICVQNKLNGKIYVGSNGRELLGLPNHEVKVNPVDHKDYIVYVQSTSLNRNLVEGTNLLVMK